MHALTQWVWLFAAMPLWFSIVELKIFISFGGTVISGKMTKLWYLVVLTTTGLAVCVAQSGNAMLSSYHAI